MQLFSFIMQKSCIKFIFAKIIVFLFYLLAQTLTKFVDFWFWEIQTGPYMTPMKAQAQDQEN